MSLESATSTIAKNRLDYIEALRGLAALYVVSFHLALIPNPALVVPFWASKFVLTGVSGVTLFFIVSAFTLTMSMRLRKQDAHLTRGFYLRRIFRIVPLFYIWIIISWLRDKFWFGVTHSWEIILLSIVFGYNLIPGQQEGFVWAGWTLGVEMLFYLMFPWIYRYIDNLGKSLGFFFFTLTLSSGFAYLIPHFVQLDATQMDSVLRFSIFHQLPSFAFGMVTYYFFERFILNKSCSKSWAFVLITASIFGYSAFLDGRFEFLMDSLYWQAVIYGALLLGLSIAPVGLFVNPITTFYGKISYSLYLNHPTLVFALIPAYRIIYNLPLSITLKYGICFLITIVLLTMISSVTYRFIEQPGMRLGSWIIKKLKPISAATSIVESK